jgi:mRNA-degrading endonuclease RelE of RelBE toxin-antitoxin system
LRFAPKGRGKSGAFRVIYYVLGENKPIIALLLYGKNEQSDLSAAQRKTVAALAAEMKRRP